MCLDLDPKTWRLHGCCIYSGHFLKEFYSFLYITKVGGLLYNVKLRFLPEVAHVYDAGTTKAALPVFTGCASN